MITASFRSFLEGCAFAFSEEPANGRLVAYTALLALAVHLQRPVKGRRGSR